ncbi:hypothetical protein FHR83_007132 [Actinoplanes campanulatus]|uniref:Uncharacterized protein n=1 Tax=Actinoplanes campanulatus TaxID=113559 RepID=A0A7W5ANK6_9ACTN|nr:hypothetical protein [Actinoplanes campanulatus]MBB3099426.1 hypothetical protein [Actinoplanes campanulatus]GGN40046.1 hypothetical protein GCM10010109_68590 [Actinoplanes campanulatus]GID42364.1 hypothetical protein Aca09nite_88700 [Actinoplanes campanulatus]
MELTHECLALVVPPGSRGPRLAQFADYSDGDPEYADTLRYWCYFGTEFTDREADVEVVQLVKAVAA